MKKLICSSDSAYHYGSVMMSSKFIRFSYRTKFIGPNLSVTHQGQLSLQGTFLINDKMRSNGPISVTSSSWTVQQVTEISFSWSHWAFKLQIHNKHYYYLWFIFVKNSYHRQIDSFEIDKILWTFHFLHTFRIGDIQDRNRTADRPIYYVANSEYNWKYFSWELVQPKTFVPFKNSIPILNFGIVT